MANETLKSPLIWSIGGVGLVVGSVVAWSYWHSHPQAVTPLAEPIPVAAKVNNQGFVPTATNPWERAKEFGWEAAVATQTAATEPDWRRVGDLWLQAIAELERIPPDSPQRADAQAKIQDYLANFEYAESAKAKARTIAPAAPFSLSAETVQAILADGPMQIKFSPATNSSTAVVGQSSDGLAKVELAGPADNLTQMTLHLPIEQGSSPLSMANMVYIDHFLTAVPDSTDHHRLTTEGLKQLKAKRNQPVAQSLGQYQITLSTDDQISRVTVSIAPGVN